MSEIDNLVSAGAFPEPLEHPAVTAAIAPSETRRTH
jgi:hypothetical protein